MKREYIKDVKKKRLEYLNKKGCKRGKRRERRGHGTKKKRRRRKIEINRDM